MSDIKLSLWIGFLICFVLLSPRVGFATSGPVTEFDYNEVLDSAILPWVSIAAQKNVILTVQKDWKSDWVYAAADQKEYSWMIRVKGGMARHPLMTKDGLTLIVCHELGHHFGGFPFEYHWSGYSNEGQADYFAAHVCAPLLWSTDIVENQKFRSVISEHAKKLCDQAWHTEDSQNLCYRVAIAAKSLSLFFAELTHEDPPDFHTQDKSVVTETLTNYPSAQCRLDTYLQGSICTAGFDLNIIPGLNTPAGKDSLDAELEAANYSCMQVNKSSIGVRPACWFKEKLILNF